MIGSYNNILQKLSNANSTTSYNTTTLNKIINNVPSDKLNVIEQLVNDLKNNNNTEFHKHFRQIISHKGGVNEDFKGYAYGLFRFNDSPSKTDNIVNVNMFGYFDLSKIKNTVEKAIRPDNSVDLKTVLNDHLKNINFTAYDYSCCSDLKKANPYAETDYVSDKVPKNLPTIESECDISIDIDSNNIITIKSIVLKGDICKEEELGNAKKKLDDADEEYKKADEEHKKADEEHKKADEEYKKADEEYKKADEEHNKADEEYKKADEEYNDANISDKQATIDKSKNEQNTINQKIYTINADINELIQKKTLLTSKNENIVSVNNQIKEKKLKLAQIQKNLEQVENILKALDKTEDEMKTLKNNSENTKKQKDTARNIFDTAINILGTANQNLKTANKNLKTATKNLETAKQNYETAKNEISKIVARCKDYVFIEPAPDNLGFLSGLIKKFENIPQEYNNSPISNIKTELQNLVNYFVIMINNKLQQQNAIVQTKITDVVKILESYNSRLTAENKTKSSLVLFMFVAVIIIIFGYMYSSNFETINKFIILAVITAIGIAYKIIESVEKIINPMVEFVYIKTGLNIEQKDVQKLAKILMNPAELSDADKTIYNNTVAKIINKDIHRYEGHIGQAKLYDELKGGTYKTTRRGFPVSKLNLTTKYKTRTVTNTDNNMIGFLINEILIAYFKIRIYIETESSNHTNAENIDFMLKTVLKIKIPVLTQNKSKTKPKSKSKSKPKSKSKRTRSRSN